MNDNGFIKFILILLAISIIILGVKIFIPKKENTKHENITDGSSISESSSSNKKQNEVKYYSLEEERRMLKKNSGFLDNGILTNSESEEAFMRTAITIFIIVFSLFFILPLIGMWKIFVDQGIPGWEVIVPILSQYRMLQIAGIPGYTLLLFFIPYLGQIALIILSIIFALKVSRLYDRGIGYAIGLIILPFIFYPLIAFKKREA